jgi:SagB-type dehydrogenase family enzyme
MKRTGQEFMVGTYPRNMSERPQDVGEPQPPLEHPLPPGAVLIPLPDPRSLDLPGLDLREAIQRRLSVRRYSDESLSQAELSSLLWLTQGVKEITGRPATLRTTPSAGARHAFETCLSIRRVEGLEPGLYRFAASQHSLAQLDAPADVHQRITHHCYDQKQIEQAAALFIWVAVLERMAWRYVERGYRYMHLDAGHVCQNLYLAAEPLGCGVCAIGAFNDEDLNQELGLDGENLFVIYLASVGKKRPG